MAESILGYLCDSVIKLMRQQSAFAIVSFYTELSIPILRFQVETVQ